MGSEDHQYPPGLIKVLHSLVLLLSLGQFADPEVPSIQLETDIKPVALGRVVKLTVRPIDRTKYPKIKTVNYEWIVTELSKSDEEPLGTDLDVDRLDETIARFGSGIKPTFVKVTVIGIYLVDDKIKRSRREFEIPIGRAGPVVPVPTPPGPGPTPVPGPVVPVPPNPVPVPPTPKTLLEFTRQLYKSNAGILLQSDADKVSKAYGGVAAIAKNQNWNAKEITDTLNSEITNLALPASWEQLFFKALVEYLSNNPARTPKQLVKQLEDISTALEN